MHAFAAAMQQYLAWLDSRPTPDKGQCRVQREGDKHRVIRQRDIGDTCQRFLRLQQSEVGERRAVLAGAKYTPTTESELGEDIAKARLVVAGVRETMRAAAGNGTCPRAELLLTQAVGDNVVRPVVGRLRKF
jgi:hypothetical protein